MKKVNTYTFTARAALLLPAGTAGLSVQVLTGYGISGGMDEAYMNVCLQKAGVV
ncbi:MAG: hypothetical protein LBG27_04175 [Spirochaetaceae bacterium]|jgi:hypothetical protein|nr:hypothetical protein [Spirochaetaceae bacterium]